MRLVGPALLLALLAPVATAQAAPHLDVALAGLPESLGVLQSGQTRDASFHVAVRMDGVVCPAETKLPVQLAVDDHTQAPFLRVALEPQTLDLVVPAGAYPGSAAGNDESYHGASDAKLRVATGGVTADTSFLIEVTATAAALPDGCKATGSVPPAKSAPLATRVDTLTPPRPVVSDAPAAVPPAPPTRAAPGPDVAWLVVAVAALGSLMRRARP